MEKRKQGKGEKEIKGTKESISFSQFIFKNNEKKIQSVYILKKVEAIFLTEINREMKLLYVQKVNSDIVTCYIKWATTS